MNSDLKITCKQASYLLNKEQETKITVADKLKLQMHLAVCSSCILFKKQIQQIVSLLQNKPSNNHSLLKSKKEIMKKELQKVMESKQN
ncbi:MAG: hypothetical protein ACOVMM_03645 [Chitinophagaceae bacterium]